MEKKCPSYLEELLQGEWERTPASVKKLVENMGHRIEILEKQQAESLLAQQQLLEKVNSTSKNSSSPPSLDPPGFEKKQKKACLLFQQLAKISSINSII